MNIRMKIALGLLAVGLFTSHGIHAQSKEKSTSKTKSQTKMKHVAVKQAIKASPEKIWAILRTGTDLDKWLPIITTCKLEGSGAGAKRICTTAEGKVLKETILNVDDAQMTFKYRIDEQDMLPTKNYVGTVSVIPTTSGAEVQWSAEFEMVVEDAFPQVEKGLSDLLAMAISGLDEAALK